MEDKRTFEISIWTLQDSFITVLESAFNKLKGKTQNATMSFNVDGTESLTFTIPMKYDLGGEIIVNPAWQNTLNGNIIANVRKVKVILNKATKDEEVHEFIINKVTEKHEKDSFFCDVECSGLAFFELGKKGYKVSLSSEDFYLDDMRWFKEEKDKNGNLLFPVQPIANLQYWADKFLTKLINEDDFSANTYKANEWYYTLQMDWTGYFNNFDSSKSSHNLYEIEDFSNHLYEEKARMIDLEESNFYNLTQNIAEVFGVYCKYKYLYDSDYHIIGRIVIFYNTFLEENNPIHITYRNQTDSISRTLDSSDLVTKMYVKTVDDSDELISIIDIEENPTGEDYLLNFDYLYSIKAIDDYQYESVKTFQKEIKNINNQLKPLSEKIFDLENKKIDYKAQKDSANAAIGLDKERINETNGLLNNLTDNTGILEVTAANPRSLPLRRDDTTGMYYVNIDDKGVIDRTIKIYKTLNFSETSLDNRLTDQITHVRPVYDEFNNVIQMTGISSDSFSSIVVYLTYSYEPQLYYENIRKIWIQRLNKDQVDYQNAEYKLAELENSLAEAYEKQERLFNEKDKLNKDFERIMGAAIKEGYWQPENYTDSGDLYVSTYSLSNISENVYGSSNFDYLQWDEEVLEGEQNLFYYFGVTQQKVYYKCIDLSSIWSDIKNNLQNYDFLYYDYTFSGEEDLSKIKIFSFGSLASVQFIKRNNRIFPGLLLIGGESFSDETWNIIRNSNYTRVGIFSGNYSISQSKEITSSMWVTLNDSYKIVHPRIFIESMSLKTSEDQLAIKINNIPLVNYTDYYITTTTKTSPIKYYFDESIKKFLDVSCYQVTLKNETIMKYYPYINTNLHIHFSLSNVDTAIFKDAISVLRESSIPMVEYEIAYDIFRNGNIKKVYDFLNKVVFINDYELIFERVKGYISEVTLNLDMPWEDALEIKNYKTKFEDLFSTIFAQTESIKKRSYLLDNVANAFYVRGDLRPEVIQKNLLDKNLNFAFNNGKLTIDEAQGIWGISDEGVVAFRGGGIFTATDKDSSGNWIWNTGIIPSGINASLITTGQLDTNKINIYAGDKVRFQLNDKGLFGYKSFLEDLNLFTQATSIIQEVDTLIKKSSDIDYKQFVRFDENGLFLAVKPGAYVWDSKSGNYKIINKSNASFDSDDELKRVSISWDGLHLKNYKGEDVFFAEADTGDLRLKGSVYADSFNVLTFNGAQETRTNVTTYIRSEGADQALTDLRYDLDNNGNIKNRIDNFILSESLELQEDYNEKIQEVNQTITTESTRITNDYTSKINELNTTIAEEKSQLQQDLQNAVSDLNTTIAEEKNNVLQDLQTAANTLNTTIANEKTNIQNDYNGKIITINNNIQTANNNITNVRNELSSAKERINTLSADIDEKVTPNVTSGTSKPTSGYKIGDIFYDTNTGQQYVCTKVSDPRVGSDWTLISTSRTQGAHMTIDPENGYIDFGAHGKIALASTSLLSFVASNDMNTSYFTISPSEVNLYGQTLKMGGGIVQLGSSDTLTLTGPRISISGTAVSLAGTNTLAITGGDLGITGTNSVRISGPNIDIFGTAGVNVTSGKGLSIGSASVLDITSGGKFKILSSETIIGVANSSSDKTLNSNAAYIHLFKNTSNKWQLGIHADTLDFTSTGELSMISASKVKILGTEVLIGAANASGNLDETHGASYIHLFNSPVSGVDKWHLNLGADKLNIASSGSLNIGTGGTLSLISGNTLKVLSSEVKIGTANTSNDLDRSASYLHLYKNSNKWKIDMSADNLNFSSTGNLSMIAGGSAQFLGADVSIGATGVNNKLDESIGASYIHMYKDTNVSPNKWKLKIGSDDVAIGANGNLTLGANSSMSFVTGELMEILGTEVKIGTIQSNTTNTLNENSSFIHLYKDVSLNKWKLAIASEELTITSGGNLTMQAGSNINLNAGGTIKLLSSSNTGITLSENGIILDSGKTLSINTTNFMIKSNSSGTTADSPFFYLGTNAINSNPSQYIKLSDNNGIQIKGNIELTNTLSASKIKGGRLELFDSGDTELLFITDRGTYKEIMGTWENQKFTISSGYFTKSSFFPDRWCYGSQIAITGSEIAFRRTTENIVPTSDISYVKPEIDNELITSDFLGNNHYLNAASIEVAFPSSGSPSSYLGADMTINSNSLFLNISKLFVKTSNMSYQSGVTRTFTIDGYRLQFVNGILIFA